MDVFYSVTPVKSGRMLQTALLRAGYGEFCGAPLLKTENGKPYLSAPNAPRFNLSHTEGLVLAAVGKQEVGIDAERRRPRKIGALLARLTEEERQEDFYELWTAKEAYIKFRGGTIAGMLPSLVFKRGVLYESGAPAEGWLEYAEIEGCTVCVCLGQREEIRFFPLG